MLRASFFVGVMLVPLLGVSAQVSVPEVPATAFAALPQTTNVELSPNGHLLAWCAQNGADVKVVIFDLDAKRVLRALNVDSAITLRSLRWADDGTLLMTFSQVREVQAAEVGTGRVVYFRTIAVDVASGKSHMLLMSSDETRWVTGAQLIASHTAQPHTVIMATWRYSDTAVRQPFGNQDTASRTESGWVYDLFRVDTRTGKGTLLDEGDHFTDQWVVNAEGAPIARSEWRGRRQYLVEVKDGSRWRRVLERPDGSVWTLFGMSSDGKSVIATGPDQNGWLKLWAVALDGSGAKELLPDVSADVVDVEQDRFSGIFTEVEFGGLDATYRWLDAAAKMRYDSVVRVFPGREVRVYDHSQDGSRVLAEVQDRSHPPTYYLVDFKTHRADMVGDAYPALDKVTLGSVRRMSYPARDGTPIPAYLTLPPGLAPKNLPMVVLPHGGPEYHDGPNFDWLAQFLAVRGYAVLQPEFRGSTGFGQAFLHAGMRQWGGLMQDDVTDGVRALIRQGLADPHRICILGAGYGGYSALAGAAFTPDLYACAVSINGASNLPEFLTYEKAHFGDDSNVASYSDQDVGMPLDQNVIDRSPVNAAAEVEAPVLLLHAVNDDVIPIAQSQEMATALGSQGRRVSFIKLPGEDHWLSRADTRLEVLEETDKFLRQYLK